jgi:hypothetical protein
MEKARVCLMLTALLGLHPSPAIGDEVSNGPDGINVPSIGLNGAGIDIGEIDETRSGDPKRLDGITPFDTDSSLVNSSVDPFQVYWRTRATLSMPATFNAHPNTSSDVKEPVLGAFVDHATQ